MEPIWPFQSGCSNSIVGFRTDMGLCPESEIPHEDTEFGRRLMRQGQRLRYEPLAVVYQAASSERLTKKHFLAFWFDHGRPTVRECGAGHNILGLPRIIFEWRRADCSGWWRLRDGF
jgi:hypothetical protein